MPTLKLTFFGSPQIELNGTPVQAPTRKALALLAYVAVTNQVQSREKLATLFWPEFSSDRAFANLREALRLLKQLLTDQWLTIQRYDVAIRVDSALSVDVHEFQRLLEHADEHPHASDVACADCLPALMTAIGLYQDDFLHGFTLPDCPGFDEWHAFQTELFREKLIASFTRIIHYATASQQYAQAVQYARQWVRLCSWSEAAHRELMRLYALNQQRSAALQQYQGCARMLQEEFGAEPEQQTTELYEAILRDELTPRPPLLKREGEQNSLSPGERVGVRGRGEIPHNLPAQTTSFIGRETEIAAVKDLLLQPDVRLVTLTGAGGSGKTRLGLRVAADVLEEFPDGVFFVSLAPISQPDLVAATIVQALEIHVTGNTPPLEALKTYLRQKQLLLVLDNFEQILEAAPMLIDLLSAAPEVKILVTSRTVLRVSGEHEYLVPPLHVPDPEHVLSFEDSTQSEAVRLFVERARAVKRAFTLTEENAPAVAGICIRLDGLPLAIELAAARLRMFSPQKLLARLSSPLQFLTGGARDLPARQRTIQNTIEWSYDLLDDEEKTLFHRLGVFVGGWTLDAAETVCALDGDPSTNAFSPELVEGSGQVLNVLPCLESLLDKNLVKQVEVQGECRFVMLETIREYALERLEESGEEHTIRQQHAHFFLALAEKAEPEIFGAESVVWVHRLERDYDNLRAALAWSIDHAIEVGLWLAGTLRTFWHVRAYQREGREWLEKALAKSQNAETNLDRFRAKALHCLCAIVQFQGDRTTACSAGEESVALWRKVGDTRGLAYALCDLGAAVRGSQGDLAKGRSLLEESIALFHQVDDKSGLPNALFWYGYVTYLQRDYEQSRSIAEECIEVAQEAGDCDRIGAGNGLLAYIADDQRDYTAAQSFYEKALMLYREVEDKIAVAILLHCLGSISYLQGNNEQARIYYEESLEIYQRTGDNSTIAWIHCHLGHVSLSRNRWQAAETYFIGSLPVHRQYEDKLSIAACLAGLAGVAEGHGQSKRAAQLLGTAEAILETVDNIPRKIAIVQTEYDRIAAIVRSTLGEDDFEAAAAKGRDMTLEQAIAYALESHKENDCEKS